MFTGKIERTYPSDTGKIHAFLCIQTLDSMVLLVILNQNYCNASQNSVLSLVQITDLKFFARASLAKRIIFTVLK